MVGGHEKRWKLSKETTKLFVQKHIEKETIWDKYRNETMQGELYAVSSCYISGAEQVWRGQLIIVFSSTEISKVSSSKEAHNFQKGAAELFQLGQGGATVLSCPLNPSLAVVDRIRVRVICFEGNNRLVPNLFVISICLSVFILRYCVSWPHMDIIYQRYDLTRGRRTGSRRDRRRNTWAWLSMTRSFCVVAGGIQLFVHGNLQLFVQHR